MFNRIRGLLNTLFSDMQSTFIWVFSIGFVVLGLMAWYGDEQNTPRFKKGMIWCAIGIVVFLLARPIVTYVQSNL